MTLPSTRIERIVIFFHVIVPNVSFNFFLDRRCYDAQSVRLYNNNNNTERVRVERGSGRSFDLFFILQVGRTFYPDCIRGENLLLTTGRKRTSRTKSRSRIFVVKKLTWSHCFGKPVEFVEFLTKLDTLKEISPSGNRIYALFYHFEKVEKGGEKEKRRNTGNKWDKFDNKRKFARYDIRV